MVVELAKSQPVADIAEQVGEHDTRPWRFIRHYMDEARLYEDYTGVETIGIDETSHRGHRYITVVADLTERNVICVAPGKDSTTVKRFADDFMAHNGDPNRVRLVTCDMDLGFAKGIRDHLPNAARTIDKFHVIKHANEAVDKVRKTEARENPPLKRTKYLWPGNESNPTDPQLEVKRNPAKRRSKTARACRMRECLQDIYADSASRTEGGGRVQGIALVDDAFAAGTDEGPRRTVPPALAGHPRLLRPSARQRDPRGTQQHHPARQDPLPAASGTWAASAP